MKKAFTMAEVLVCVGIIGIMSSLTLMHVRSNNVKQNILLYKNTFASIQEVASKLVGDTTVFPVPQDGFRRSAANVTVANINTASDASYFCEQLTNKLITKKTRAEKRTISGEQKTVNVRDVKCNLSVRAVGEGATEKSFDPNITLSNGVQIAGLDIPFSEDTNRNDFIESHLDICIDTNEGRGPNKGCVDTAVKDRDRFRIRIYFNGKVTTDPAWVFENEILDPSENSVNLKSEKFSDAVTEAKTK